MTAVGGSIESVAIRGRLFPVASDADASIKLGGYEAEVQANGDGTARKILMRVPWSVDGIQLEIDDNRADHEFLQEMSAEKDWVTIEITLASGVTWQGRGTVASENSRSTNNTTAGVTLSGPGEFTQQ
jgi:hypothetical protein